MMIMRIMVMILIMITRIMMIMWIIVMKMIMIIRIIMMTLTKQGHWARLSCMGV